MIPAKFLKKYDNIVFELDGVIASNRHYITCAALSVYEMCNSDKYYGKSALDYTSVFNNQKQITDLLFCNGKFVDLLYECGIDNMRDCAYVLLAGILGLGERRDFSNICNYFRYINLHTSDIFDHCAILLGRAFPRKKCGRFEDMWNTLNQCFTEWLFGDELYEMFFDGPPSVHGKLPLIANDQLYHSLINTKDVFSSLKSSGFRISIVTQRPRSEVEPSFARWKFNEIFTKDDIITLDDILDSHHKANLNMPNSPDPYCFARAAIGAEYADENFFAGNYSDKFSRTIIVSASPVSLFIAKELGADFAAIASDPSNKSLKDMFRQLESDYVLDSMLDLIIQPKN
ncbi:MAG: hypothetical protein Q8873_07015 [Bacillota bacterium]|nr:hypothetical protein [Bacillota bacterium]